MLIVLYYIIYGKDNLSFQLFILLQLLILMVSMCQSNVILYGFLELYNNYVILQGPKLSLNKQFDMAPIIKSFIMLYPIAR